MRAQQAETRHQPMRRPVLPGRMQRSQVEGLLADVGPALGLTAPVIFALQMMIRKTKPEDWITPRRDPVCFMSQTDIALALQRTPRQVYSYERALECAGLVWKRVGNDGARGSFGVDDEGAPLQLGINFRPLIERIPDLLDLRDLIETERRQRQTLRRLCSSLRRDLRRTVDQIAALDANHPGLPVLIDGMASWHRRFDAYPTLKALEEHRQAVENMAYKALSFLAMCENTSGVSEADFRPLQDTTKELPVVCNAAAVDEGTGRTRPDDQSLRGEPDGSPKGLENKNAAVPGARKPDWLRNLKPRQLYALCSEEMRFYLDAFRGNKPTLTHLDFIQAAIMRLPELGIDGSAWTEAIAAMGDMTAALCVLIVDANRTHPVTPIRKPGGALRGMVRRHGLGQLNITGSLIGLSERLRND